MYYDAEETPGGGQICHQGHRRYIETCAEPTDFASYLRYARPTVAGNTTCEALGFRFLGHGIAFPGEDMYWKGSEAAYKAYMATLGPSAFALLATARAGNPACRT